MAVVCPTCSRSETYNDDRGGATLCAFCGTVLTQDKVVSTVEFQENAGGTSSVVGQFVSATATRPYSSRSSIGYGAKPGVFTQGRESRELAAENGRRLISQLAGSLGVDQSGVDNAVRNYRIALDHNFVQGRRANVVAAVCLYCVCRRDRTAHMMLDFSEAIRVNVFTLGQTYVQFRPLLPYRLPLPDPSCFIGRFAAKMEFGDKKLEVAATARRLVEIMQRDWIVTGRSPTGVCAACLLVAARAHGFRRRRADVVRIARTTDATLLNRLAEFEATPAASLKASQIHDARALLALPAADPPAFVRAQLERADLERRALALQDVPRASITGSAGQLLAVMDAPAQQSPMTSSSAGAGSLALVASAEPPGSSLALPSTADLAELGAEEESLLRRSTVLSDAEGRAMLASLPATRRAVSLGLLPRSALRLAGSATASAASNPASATPSSSHPSAAAAEAAASASAPHGSAGGATPPTPSRYADAPSTPDPADPEAEPEDDPAEPQAEPERTSEATVQRNHDPPPTSASSSSASSSSSSSAQIPVSAAEALAALHREARLVPGVGPPRRPRAAAEQGRAAMPGTGGDGSHGSDDEDHSEVLEDEDEDEDEEAPADSDAEKTAESDTGGDADPMMYDVDKPAAASALNSEAAGMQAAISRRLLDRDAALGWGAGLGPTQHVAGSAGSSEEAVVRMANVDWGAGVDAAEGSAETDATRSTEHQGVSRSSLGGGGGSGPAAGSPPGGRTWRESATGRGPSAGGGGHGEEDGQLSPMEEDDAELLLLQSDEASRRSQVWHAMYGRQLGQARGREAEIDAARAAGHSRGRRTHAGVGSGRGGGVSGRGNSGGGSDVAPVTSAVVPVSSKINFDRLNQLTSTLSYQASAAFGRQAADSDSSRARASARTNAHAVPDKPVVRASRSRIPALFPDAAPPGQKPAGLGRAKRPSARTAAALLNIPDSSLDPPSAAAAATSALPSESGGLGGSAVGGSVPLASSNASTGSRQSVGRRVRGARPRLPGPNREGSSAGRAVGLGRGERPVGRRRLAVPVASARAVAVRAAGERAPAGSDAGASAGAITQTQPEAAEEGEEGQGKRLRWADGNWGPSLEDGEQSGSEELVPEARQTAQEDYEGSGDEYE